MQHDIGLVPGKGRNQRCVVANICLYKGVKWAVRHWGQIGQIGGIGQRIKVHHLMPTLHRQPHHGRADKPRPACDH